MRKKIYIKRFLSYIIIVTFSILIYSLTAISATETPEKIFTGVSTVSKLFNRINYPDIKNSKSFAKEAIYETSALGLFKLQNGAQFKANSPITKEQAISVILTSVGLENSSINTANKLYDAANPTLTSNDALKAVYDGFFNVAKTAKIITDKELTEAIANSKTGFVRYAPATRQEVAFWLGTALKLKLSTGISNTYMNYKDWRNIDPNKVLMVEIMLQNNIMNGDGNGNFNPKAYVKMEEMAQIIKNADDFIYPLSLIIKYTGTIENIITSKNPKTSSSSIIVSYIVRNSEGGLHKLDTFGNVQFGNIKKNENSKSPLPIGENDFITYKNSQLGTSKILKIGDRIEYTVKSGSNILYASTISSIFDTNYLVGMFNSISPSSNTITITPMIKLLYPKINLGSTLANFTSNDTKNTEKYVYSKGIVLTTNSKQITTKDLKEGQIFLFTIKGNVVTSGEGMETPQAGLSGIYSGIIEEYNETLGYISLYSIGYDNSNEPYKLDTYSISDISNIEVTKNGISSEISSIEAGDTVFFRIDSSKKINAISAVSNNSTIYGKVLQAKSSSLRVQLENGNNVVYRIKGSEAVLLGNSIVSYKSIKDGDNIKLVINEKNNNLDIKLISIQHNFYKINNILKGQMSFYDKNMKVITLTGVEYLVDGSWKRSDVKGVTKLNIADDCAFYDENGNIIKDGASGLFENKLIYVAMRGDFGKENYAESVLLARSDSAEIIINDRLSGVTNNGIISIPSSNKPIEVNSGTIVVNNGRLLTAGSITDADNAVVVANRNSIDGKLYASIINIYPYDPFGGVSLIRGRIKAIKPNQEFSLESYSKLEGETWKFINTPITFKMDKDMQIASDKDMLNNRDFVPYGIDSFLEKVIYVVSDGTNAKYISTAPHGQFAFEGEVYSITGGEFDTEGEVITQPSGIKLYNTKLFDMANQIWKNTSEITLTLLNNSITIKNGTIIKPEGIKNGDKLRIYKKDDKTTGDAFIVIVK
jgi:hypothetical protein